LARPRRLDRCIAPGPLGNWAGRDLRHLRARVPPKCGCKISPADCVHLRSSVRRDSGGVWRRGWDSDPITSCRFCNFQQPRCRSCHTCQRYRGALHPIAPGPAAQTSRRDSSEHRRWTRAASFLNAFQRSDLTHAQPQATLKGGAARASGFSVTPPGRGRECDAGTREPPHATSNAIAAVARLHPLGPPAGASVPIKATAAPRAATAT
jgi:hypothetical protein